MENYISFDGISGRYPSRRSVVYGKQGMVCTSQTLAAQAGLDVLKKGGNAIDAAIATAICLTVLEPPSNGIGSDLFALVWYRGKLYGLNGSGPAPLGITREAVLKKIGESVELREKYDTQKENGTGTVLDLSASAMPDKGWETVTVPGAPASWKALHERFGAAAFRTLFEAAIRYAEDGFPLQPVCSRLWNKNAQKVAVLEQDALYQPLLDTFFKGKQFTPGRLIRLPEMGKTLRELAESDCNSFYRGNIAREIISFSQATGG